MAISYTDNFEFALLDTGSSNWGAVTNSMLEKVDLELKAAQTPISLLSTQATLIQRSTGETILKHYSGNN